jgi:hypothetical protein
VVRAKGKAEVQDRAGKGGFRPNSDSPERRRALSASPKACFCSKPIPGVYDRFTLARARSLAVSIQHIEPRLRAEAADEAAQCNWFIAGAAARPAARCAMRRRPLFDGRGPVVEIHAPGRELPLTRHPNQRSSP